jgi:dextranase
LSKKIIALILIISTAIFGALYMYRNIFSFKDDNNIVALTKGKLISDVYTDKARYYPSDKVTIKIELNNELQEDFRGTIYIFYKHFESIVGKAKIQVNIKSGQKKQLNIFWEAPKDDFKGYLVEVYAVKGNKAIDNKNTAVDVSSDWSKFPRYGYIANFPEQSKEKSALIIEDLNRYHLNGLQFYDWQYKHNKPLAGTVENPDLKWKDIANRDIYGQTVKDYIELAHSKNMMAANYNLMYGGYFDYVKDGAKPEWGLYKDPNHEEQDNHPLPHTWATDRLYLFNPANKDWQNYIFNAEKDAFGVYNFDVWHVDTLGPRGTVYDYKGNPVELSMTYADFLNNAKKALGKRIVCNTVNEYGLINVASGADVDFLYAEIWPPGRAHYNFLKQTVDNGYNYSDGKKATVVAAYMNYGIADRSAEFNKHSVRLTDAAIFAAGGDHIELGDTGMLSKEYFPSANLKMSESLVKAMRNYYDFLTAYENLLRDGLKESDNKIEIPGIEISNNGSARTVWTYAKQKDGYDVIHMINLLGIEVSNWRDDLGNYSAPPIIKDFKVKYYLENDNIKNVYLASPDINDGKVMKLQFKKKEDSKGKYLEISVPELQYWDMIFIKK